ncbi:MAG: hypothetical protein FWH14_01890 [Oscillospiraceae bacterium]|nr:hypothetical protein [Oscillospiraceae bacterium]
MTINNVQLTVTGGNHEKHERHETSPSQSAIITVRTGVRTLQELIIASPCPLS